MPMTASQKVQKVRCLAVLVVTQLAALLFVVAAVESMLCRPGPATTEGQYSRVFVGVSGEVGTLFLCA